MIKIFYLFTANTKATGEDVISISDLNNPVLDQKLGEKDAAQLREDVELVDGVHGNLNVNDYLAGKVAPVFFGSAINNFGVKEMLDTFHSHCADAKQPGNFDAISQCGRR